MFYLPFLNLNPNFFLQLYFFFAPFPIFFPPNFYFLLELYFLSAFHLVFFCHFKNFLHPPTYYPPLSPTDLLTYILKLEVNSSPSTYSLLNLKCVIFIPTHLATLPPCYLPNPTYMATPTYMVTITIDSQWLITMKKE